MSGYYGGRDCRWGGFPFAQQSFMGNTLLWLLWFMVVGALVEGGEGTQVVLDCESVVNVAGETLADVEFVVCGFVLYFYYFVLSFSFFSLLFLLLVS